MSRITTISPGVILLAITLGSSTGHGAAIFWTGQTNGINDPNWTTAAANKNWIDGDSNAASFKDGDGVNFEDTPAVGPTAIMIQGFGVAPSSVVFQNNNKTFSFTGGPIIGDTSLNLVGAGVVELANVNAYTGGTSVGGTLIVPRVNGSNTGTGDVDVAGELRGNAVLRGRVKTLDGGKVAPGVVHGGTLSLGGLDMGAGGTYLWELASHSVDNPGEDFDLIFLAAGNLVLGPNAILAISFVDTATFPQESIPFWRIDHQWKVIDVFDPSQNSGNMTFGQLLDASYDAGVFTTFVGTGPDQGDVFLRFTAVPETVPEPGSLGLIGPGILGAIGHGWLRRRLAATRRTQRPRQVLRWWMVLAVVVILWGTSPLPPWPRPFPMLSSSNCSRTWAATSLKHETRPRRTSPASRRVDG